MTDSRGHGLRQYLDIPAPNVFRVSARSGDRMAGLFKRAVKKLKNNHENYTVIIIMGGICDITKRDPITKQTHLRSWELETITKQMRKDIKKGLKRIKRWAPNTPVIITPTIGINLEQYNGVPTDNNEQESLNEIVLQVNRLLISCNKRENKIPWISRTVHHCKGKGCWDHKYHYLGDGCHFDIKLKRIIAKELSKSLINV